MTHERSGLRTREAGTGALPFVLIHGYGSSAAEWIPFTHTIDLPAGRRFVMPEGPETTTPPDGPANGRAWWRLGLDAHRRAGDGLPDLAPTNPPGLLASNRRIRTLLDELATSWPLAAASDRCWPAFRRAAIIAADIAFTTDEPMEALVLLSPTFVNETAWRSGMARDVDCASSSRTDGATASCRSMSPDRLQQAMRDAGLRVTWFPFDGGHEMPAEVVGALNAFLAQRASQAAAWLGLSSSQPQPLRRRGPRHR